MEALHEIQVAELLGFTRVKDWERARRKGLIPAPDQELPDGPRWDRERLLAWLRGTEETTSLMDDEKELIERANGKDTCAVLHDRPQAARRRRSR